MLTKEELLKVCDENTAKMLEPKNEIVENIVYVLKERGYNIKTVDTKMIKVLRFEHSICCDDKVYPKIEYGLSVDQGFDTTINCIDKIYNNGGIEALENFLLYIVSAAIPNFKANIKMPIFKYATL